MGAAAPEPAAPTPDGLPPLREVVARYGLGARKRLGQHFLFDFNITRRIARAAGPFSPGDLVIEIGPGPGGLTRALLLEGAPEVFAIDQDPRVAPVMADIAACYPGRLSYQIGDARRLDMQAVAGARPVHVVANLPYNVGTHLLLGWLAQEPWPPIWRSLTLMFQKEVAQRLLAAPGTPEYGALTVLARWRAKVKALMHLPARAFVPPPKVDSTLVQITPLPQPAPELTFRDLDRLLRPIFSRRRKMLRRSLKALARDPQALLAKTGIEPTARPEALAVADLLALAAALKEEG